jgi:uncharacterized cupin superfamily protein
VGPEAPLEETQHGRVPRGEGWFVLNAEDSLWEEGAFGAYTRFEGDVRFGQVGVNLSVLAPGQAACMYHAETEQEGFLVLRGECLLLVEGQERPLRAWDFFHCPASTEHVLVGAGTGDCLILAIGSRSGGDVVYPAAEFARRHGAAVAETTTESKQAYADFPPDTPTRARPGWLELA